MELEDEKVTRVQTEGRIKGILDAHLFDKHVDSETDEYWGVPAKFFTKEGNSVFLDAAVADELTWMVTARVGSAFEVSALPQKITVEGEEYGINPGFWAASVDESVIQ